MQKSPSVHGEVYNRRRAHASRLAVRARSGSLYAMTVLGIDHILLAMPPGEEAKARAFYTGVLQLQEKVKPAALAARGGAWFTNGTIEVHLGVEKDFRPARKAHPAFVVRDRFAVPALQSRAHSLRRARAARGQPCAPGRLHAGRYLSRVWYADDKVL